MNRPTPRLQQAPTRRWRVATAGAELAVLEVGEVHRPAVVVAHGAGSSARFVQAAFASAVTAAGRRLVAYDLRGHADSSPAPTPADHHLDVHASDLAAVAAGVPGDLEAVGGVSLGAHAAVRAVTSAGLPPPTALVACLPAWTGHASRGVGPHAAIAAEVRRDGPAALLARLRGETSLPGWLRSTLVVDYARHDPDSLAATLVALDGGEAPTADELAALPAPLAVVGWPGDPGHPLAQARRWTGLAPRAVLRELTIDDLEGDLGALGRVAVSALDALLATAAR